MTTLSMAACSQPGLVECVYDDVRRIASRQRRRFLGDDAPATTTLARHAFHRIRAEPQSPSEILRATAVAMREVIADLARSKASFKRDSDQTGPVDAEKLEVACGLWIDGGEERIVALDEALQRLRALNPRLGAVVDCRFFAGYTAGETAEALDLDERTAQREWAKARAWLYREIGPDL